MKRCPACSRTYANDAQKFCTQDGIVLVDAHSAGAGQGETVRIDSAQLDDEVTKVISKGLPRTTGSGFDPYRTVISSAQETSATRPSAKTEDLAPPAQATSPPQPPVTPAPPPPSVASDQVAAAAPIAPPPVVPAASVASSPGPPKKTSKLPLILGILAALLL